MGDFSEIEKAELQAVTINVPPYCADHRFQERAVLPAVEALRLLADWARRFRPGISVQKMARARFDKFLDLSPDSGQVAAYCDTSVLADGTVRVSLITKQRAKSAAITRAKTHAQVDFPQAPAAPLALSLDLAAALEGLCFTVDLQCIYPGLVPFGPAYRNISGPLRLTAEGALALIRAPAPAHRCPTGPLGSPFVLDAAFQAACVWGQRFAGVVAFPVGIEERLLVQPTLPGDAYVSRIFPVRKSRDLLVFDIWILDLNGHLFETLRGVHMRDVSGGRWHPPGWIRAERVIGLRDRWAPHCAAIALIERDTLMPFADRCLSAPERQRSALMTPKRRTAFMAARLVCKRLSRKISGNDHQTPAADITTFGADDGRPRCPVTSGRRSYYCSVSHNRRFAVGVAGTTPIGVDVETLTPRLLKTRHLFMNLVEQERVHRSPLGEVEAAARVWSIKEAVAKALDISLADAWHRCEVTAIGAVESRFQLQNGRSAAAVHQGVERNLFTLVFNLGDLNGEAAA